MGEDVGADLERPRDRLSGLPAVVTHTGNVFGLGVGWVTTDTGLASAPGKGTASPVHSFLTVSMSSNIAALLRGGAFSGRRTKSSGIHPDAKASPARPLLMLSMNRPLLSHPIGW